MVFLVHAMWLLFSSRYVVLVHATSLLWLLKVHWAFAVLGRCYGRELGHALRV
jgi:hypothetical protein